MRNYLPISFTAGFITFGLFAFMAFLISNNDKISTTFPETVKFDVFQTPKNSKVNVKEIKPLTPPPVLKQPPRTMTEVDPSNVNNELIYTSHNIKLPSSQTSIGGGGALIDTDARPIVQIPPKYPIKAATNGIEGWVKLSFNINPLGEVTNIKVLDSDPRRIFDKAAKSALKKWKYKAKRVGGKSLEQKNITVQLDFKMDNNQT